jgi:hypothetical protein
MKSILFVVVLGFAQASAAAQGTICNDAFSFSEPGQFMRGFLDGEGVAVKVDAPDGGAFSIHTVDVFYGAADGNGTVTETATIAIFDDTGLDRTNQPGYPGAELFHASVDLLSFNDRFNSVILGSVPVDSGSVWITLNFPQAADNGIAIDNDDTVDSDRNLIFIDGRWGPATAGTIITGDWAMRAEVTTSSDAALDDACVLGSFRLQNVDVTDIVSAGEGEDESEGDGEGDVARDNDDPEGCSASNRSSTSALLVLATTLVRYRGVSFPIRRRRRASQDAERRGPGAHRT